MVSLNMVAAEMLDVLEGKHTGRAHAALSHGLNIVLVRKAGCDVLKLGRRNVYPSDLEITLVLRAFGWPDDELGERQPPNADGWHVVLVQGRNA